jgi:hypothetical protein
MNKTFDGSCPLLDIEILIRAMRAAETRPQPEEYRLETERAVQHGRRGQTST